MPAVRGAGGGGAGGASIRRQARRFGVLQAFRALAAMAVVMQHAAISTQAFVGSIPPLADRVFSRGFLGVDFFFVLSGFIILSSHFEDSQTGSALLAYLCKRFARIYPPYWPISLAMLGIYALYPALSAVSHGGFSLVGSLLLVPTSGSIALVVAWTLVYEVLFYLVFCLFFASRGGFGCFVCVWALAILLLEAFPGDRPASPLPAHLLAPINLEFILGMGTAVLARRQLSGRSGVVLVGLSCLMFAGLVEWFPTEAHREAYGLPFAMLVLGAVVLERRGWLHAPQWSVLLGDASYAIYLVHDPAISVAVRAVAHVNIVRIWQAGMLLTALAGIVTGVAYHLLAERRLTAACRRILRC